MPLFSPHFSRHLLPNNQTLQTINQILHLILQLKTYLGTHQSNTPNQQLKQHTMRPWGRPAPTMGWPGMRRGWDDRMPNYGIGDEWGRFMRGEPMPFGIRDRWSTGFGTFGNPRPGRSVRGRQLNPRATAFRPRF
jgi:hypothetical protein